MVVVLVLKSWDWVRPPLLGTKSQLLPKISFEGSPKFGHPDSLVTLFSLVTLVSLVTPVSLVTLLVVGAHFSVHFFTVLHFS